jgi:hypothetical protein
MSQIFGRIFLTFSFLFFLKLSLAQIINIEEQRMKEKDGWQGLIRADFYTSKNKKEFYRFNVGSQLQYKKKKNTFISSNNLRMIFTDEDDIENRGFQHFRYNRELDSHFVWEAFTQLQTDHILQIKLRWLIGSGPMFKLYNKEKTKIRVGSIYMYEYEEEAGTDIIHRNHRLSNYLTLSYKFNKVFSLYNITYYQPRLDKFHDYRLSSGTSLGIKVFKNLSLNVSFQMNYDAYPVENAEIEKLTYTMLNGVSYKF